MGPLVVSGSNSNFFAKPNGTIVYLTGSHTWNNLQELSDAANFDYAGYLTFLSGNNNTCIRLWAWESPKGLSGYNGTSFSPMPFTRSGTPGEGDGGNKFDLTLFDSAGYFARLRQHVIDAGNAGIYVSIMLFNWYSLHSFGWTNHPYKSVNNINSINGDPATSGDGDITHSLIGSVAAVNAIQKDLRQEGHRYG